jgi:acetyl-CoA carboxylase carboxyltransferase component
MPAATGVKASTGNGWKELLASMQEQEAALKEGGGPSGQARQHRLGRLLVRERIEQLLDPDTPFFECGLWAAHGMYEEWGSLPAAGVVTGVGNICGRPCMIVANDATVKAGAMFPQSIKKLLRAQRIASQCRLPLIYLVDSSGVFLPLQDEIFPDEDDFGRIFRNNSVLSAAGIPQIAAVMGNCIAGGAYLPVLCDKLLMTEGSGLYLAGPALVKAAIGQEVEAEELGGAKMHAEISGTVDFHEPDDPSCLRRIRSLVDKLPEAERPLVRAEDFAAPENQGTAVYDLVSVQGNKMYDARELIKTLVDPASMDEYKASYGQTLVTVYAKIGGRPVGIVANQRMQVQSPKNGIEIGGVIYADSADKAARFVMDCNQARIPLLFLQDVVGFMVGKQAEQSGIIRCGAKLVNALSNCVVPKVTLVVGNSFGAGNYALCGKAYDPTFILAWPNAKYAVMGGGQAADTLYHIQARAAKRLGKEISESEAKAMKEKIAQRYKEQMDIRYGAARGWVDAIIQPEQTREALINVFRLVANRPEKADPFHTGVLQV